MAKTATPGKVVLDHGTFQANAVPDVFDARDLEYRPRLQALPKELECRPEDRYVMSQDGSSCTGHAVAAMINAVLASQGDTTHVSPYMLYALARRYDEFQGSGDVGSSLRGALKGWYYHGVLPDSKWSELNPSPTPDIDHDKKLSALAATRPLGAFYRVNASRLDDLQSAVNELSAIVVSASVHDGWYTPVLVTRTVNRKKQRMYVINKTKTPKAVGGHAFCIAGYNDVGFLVQNSWGAEWGANGFATLPYDDWLESGYDAWVARPGVPSVISDRTRQKILGLAGGGLVNAPGPDLTELANHVVNLGNDGKLSTSGRFTSSSAQLEKIFDHMGTVHAEWDTTPRRIMIYAHGGLDSEKTGLDIAQRQLHWWLNNKVYPVTFAWQTGLTETFEDQLTDLFGSRRPAGGWPFNLTEQVDRMVEKAARTSMRWVWDEMKENAVRASDPLPRNYRKLPDENLPGASLTVAYLKAHLQQRPRVPTEVHLVGHSAGSIFLMSLIERLVAAGIEIASLTYLAAAIRTDDWMKQVLPHLTSGAVKQFSGFGMSPGRELDDVCGTHGITVYHKSLLYLVSRALERPVGDDTEVPLVGMAHFAKTTVEGKTLVESVADLGGDLIWSPSATPPDSRSDSSSHGGFDDDSPTMTSVLLRILGQEDVEPGNQYVANLPSSAPTAGAKPRPPRSRVITAMERDGWAKTPAR